MKNRLYGKKDQDTHCVVAYFGEPEEASFVVVTVHSDADEPFSMGFFRDPTEPDPEKLLRRAMKWAKRQGVRRTYVLHGVHPVAHAFCECCGDLKDCFVDVDAAEVDS